MVTWEAFKAHRRECSGRLWAAPQTPPAPPPLSGGDLDRLADLYAQLEAETGAAPGAGGGE